MPYIRFEFPANFFSKFRQKIKGEFKPSPLVPKSPMLYYEKVPIPEGTPTLQCLTHCGGGGDLSQILPYHRLTKYP